MAAKKKKSRSARTKKKIPATKAPVNKVLTMSPSAMQQQLERYCIQMFEDLRKKYGTPSKFSVSWDDAAYWCRAFNLGWEATIDGKSLHKAWDDGLDITEFDPAPFAKLYERHKKMKPFFMSGEEFVFEGEWEFPAGEMGLWVRAVYDAAISAVISKLKSEPRFKNVGFSIEGHDGAGPYSAEHYAREIAELRHEQDYEPDPDFLKKFFSLFFDDMAAVERWTQIAISLFRPQQEGLGLEYSFLLDVGRDTWEVKKFPQEIDEHLQSLAMGKPVASKIKTGIEVLVEPTYPGQNFRSDRIYYDDFNKERNAKLLVISKRFKELLEKHGTAEIECIPFWLVDKERTFKKEWFIANVLSLQDCVDEKKSVFKLVLGMKRQIVVLDEKKLESELNLFRLAARPDIYVIRNDLKIQLDKSKVKGIKYLPLDERSQEKYWGP